MTSPSEAEVKARLTGAVYVLKAFRGDRSVSPFEHNVGTRLLQRMDSIYGFPDPAVRGFLDGIRQDDVEVREWHSAAAAGMFFQRRTDTWERIYVILRDRAERGATSAEVQRHIGLGHGAVSAVLSRWDQAGVVCRLREEEA